MASCGADRSEDHCCWLAGDVCEFLAARVDGRRWSCTLRAELGSWDAMYADDRYRSTVRPVLDRSGLPDCGDWPRPDELCHACGVKG